MSLAANKNSLTSCVLDKIQAENTKPPTRINKRNSQGRVCVSGKTQTWGNRSKNILRSKTEREAS